MEEPLVTVCWRHRSSHDLQVVTNHFGDEVVQFCLMAPAELLMRLGWIADQQIHFGGSKIARIDLDENAPIRRIDPLLFNALALPFQIDANLAKSLFNEAAHAMGLAGRKP